MTCAYEKRVAVQPRSCSGVAEEWHGPEGYTLLSWEVDFRTGGASRLRLRSPEGRDQLLEGAQLELAEPERVVFRADPEVDHPPGHSGTLTFRRK